MERKEGRCAERSFHSWVKGHRKRGVGSSEAYG